MDGKIGTIISYVIFGNFMETGKGSFMYLVIIFFLILFRKEEPVFRLELFGKRFFSV